MERRVVDTVLSARWIVPVEPEGVVLEHHSLIADGGKIVDIIPTLEAEKTFVQREPDVSTQDFYLHHMLIPGLSLSPLLPPSLCVSPSVKVRG